VPNSQKICYAIHLDTQQQKEIAAYTTDAFNFQMIGGYLISDDGNYFKAISN
jgi:hypothetical protein